MRGKLVILAILGVAILATGGAWVYQRSMGARAIGYWGTEQAWLVRFGRDLQLIRLGPLTTNLGQPPMEDSANYSILSTANLAESKGVLHFRQALIGDASFSMG